MAIAYLVKINDTAIPKVKEFTVTREALWTNAGRNMAGELKATLVGYFPKITLGFSMLTLDEMNDLIALLEQPSFTLSWYDERTQTNKSALYYAGAYNYSLYSIERGLYKDFTVNLIPYKKYV